MEEFLTYLIGSIVTKDEEIKIETKEEGDSTTYTLFVNPEELGKVIGKKGKTITAIRNLANVYAHKNSPDNTKRIYISVGEEK
jgi:predicted RNA-binding protein YlqC (UPF0109 family)